MDAEPEYVAETLAWCNTIREANGEEPLDRLPKGYRHDPASCPCGSATGVLVEATHYHKVSKEGVSTDDLVALPFAVRQFVSHFDAGELEQYNAKLEDEEECDDDDW